MSATPRVTNRIGEQKFPFLSNEETGIVAKASGNQSTATALTAQISRVDTVASGNDSVALPKIVAKPGVLGSLGTIMFVANNGANSMQVYGQTPDTINAVATGTGVAVAAGVNVWFVAVGYTQSTNVGTWLMTNSQAAAVAAITSGTIAGVAITDSTYTGVQGTPNTQTTDATLTAANLLTRMIVATPAAAVTYTLPTGTLMEGAATWATNECFDWSIVNIATNDTYIITVAAGSGHTIVGAVGVAPNGSTTGALYGSSALFRTRKTGTNTFVTYRIA